MIVRLNGIDYIIWQARLKDEFQYICQKANPELWFARRKADQEYIGCAPTKEVILEACRNIT